ncbi:MAG: hypothetical protein NC548_10725 [Lachnospiraceae bacterium]|nr:hypothetical protein [Lachnospiraceae bacterium]
MRILKRWIPVMITCILTLFVFMEACKAYATKDLCTLEVEAQLKLTVDKSTTNTKSYSGVYSYSVDGIEYPYQGVESYAYEWLVPSAITIHVNPDDASQTYSSTKILVFFLGTAMLAWLDFYLYKHLVLGVPFRKEEY